MNINIKGGRIWLQKEIQKGIGNSFINIRLRKNEKDVSFITKITKEGRFAIPKKVRDILKLKINDEVNIKITKISNKKRSKKFIKNNSFDMLSFVPQKTMSNYEILVTEKNKKLHLWYSTQGRPNKIIINRYVPSNISKWLGYYQAEGGKPRFQNRRGREFSFTNKNLKLIQEFILLSKNIFDIKLLNVIIRYNKQGYRKEADNVFNQLIKLGINPNKMTIKEADRISTYTIRLWISNSLLAETIFNMLNKVRGYIIEEKLTKFNKKILLSFLQGLILGDGGLYYDKNRSCIHPRIQIFEGNKEYVKDYSTLLNKIGIHGKINKDKIKNMYIFYVFMNWGYLLKLLELKLFNGTRYNGILRKIIKRHKKYRPLKHFIDLPKRFTISDFIKFSKKTYNYSNAWLDERAKKGLIKKVGKDKNKNIWQITKKGEDLQILLNKLR